MKYKSFPVEWKNCFEYLRPGILAPTLNKFRHNLFKIEQLEHVIEKASPTNAFTLYECCSFWCACRVNDLSKKEFEQHIKEHHRELKALCNSTEILDKYVY